MCAMYTSLAVTIAVRYCASRKQFGPKPDEEWPVIEYQVQVKYCQKSVAFPDNEFTQFF